MKFILNKDCRLRGWTDHLACLERYPYRNTIDLKTCEYGLLSKCDGKTEVDTQRYAEAIKKFTEQGIIIETDGADHSSQTK